jgi:serine/threonine protein phosphatase 1
MRTFIIGDIHGEYNRLMSCLKAVKFDYDNDRLIQLGDVCDRGPDSYLVVEELLKIKNLIAIRGNHDECFFESTKTGRNVLYDQGGRETLLSYTRAVNCDGDPTKIPETHKKFYQDQLPYFIDENNNLFIHGGFNRHLKIKNQDPNVFIWDRDLWLSALSFQSMKNNEYKFKIKDNFNHVYIGHTPTQYHGSDRPMTAANITNLDTGAGKGGILTIMNLETKEIYQS